MFRTCLVTTVLAGLSALVSVACAEDKPSKTDAAEVLKRVRETYSNLRDFHFEHAVLIEEMKEGKSAKVSEITFVIACAGAMGPPPEDRSAAKIPMGMGRVRMEVKGTPADIAVVSDGESAVMYLRDRNQYKRAENMMRAIGGPTSATMFMALFYAPLTIYADQSLQSPKLLREEKIQIGEEKKNCYVVEAIIKAPPIPLPEGVERPDAVPEDFNPLAGPPGLLMLLGMHGLVGGAERVMYMGGLGEKPVPALITLWIGQDEPIVWKTSMSQMVTKISERVLDTESKPDVVEVRMTDTFSIDKIKGPLPENIFTFTPPKDAKQVEKFQERREKQ